MVKKSEPKLQECEVQLCASELEESVPTTEFCEFGSVYP